MNSIQPKCRQRFVDSSPEAIPEMTARWAKAVAPVAEGTAQAFLRSQSESDTRMGSLPTLLTEANRSAGREATKRKAAKAETSPGLGLPRASKDCGVVLDELSCTYCDACYPERRAQAVAQFANAGPTALAKRRAEGTDPAHPEEARRKQGLRAAINARANAEWDMSGHVELSEIGFERDILPGIQPLPLSRIHGSNRTFA
jgi:hypothetical protein